MSEKLTLSLTGPASHRLTLEPGVGSLAIGPADGLQRPDLLVAPDDAIDWHVFDGMQTGAGSNWPRYIYYEGNDISLFEWMRERETEEIRFAARTDLSIDAPDADLGGMTLWPGAHHIAITLPRTLRRLGIVGDPGQVAFEVLPGGNWPSLSLSAQDGGAFTSIAGLNHHAGIRSLSIHNHVLGAPFDCRSLLPLRDLQHLSLRGAMSHLDALDGFRLTGLELRFIPDLAGLPDLTAWPELRYFVAWNVDEIIGKPLRKAIKQLPTGEDHHASVSQLRDRQWFIEEHGLPFGAWPGKNEKIASKAFKAASKILRGSTSKNEAREAITGFVQVINGLTRIETSERDDAGDAVAMLAEVQPGLVSADEALAWFDEVRDF